jgi:hypothetical protein
MTDASGGQPSADPATAPAPSEPGPTWTAAGSPAETITPARFLADVAGVLGAPYAVVSDRAFHWLTPFGADHERLAAHARHALLRLPEVIPGLEPEPPPGGWPAVLFASTDDQLAYEGLFGGSGASIISGGCWRSFPVGHLAVPVTGREALDAAFGHELVHAVLSGSGVPTWLQEGIATELETRMGNRAPPLADLYTWRATLTYWREHPAGPFWSGAAFRDPASSEHAYRLAQLLGYHWTRRPERLRAARDLGRAAWKDQDGALLGLIGADRAGLLRAVLAPDRRRGWLDRFLHWCFVHDAP